MSPRQRTLKVSTKAVYVFVKTADSTSGDEIDKPESWLYARGTAQDSRKPIRLVALGGAENLKNLSPTTND